MLRSKLLLSCVLMLVFAVAASAQPKLKIAEENFDFGYTPEGLPVMHKYWAHNVGTDTLKIIRVRPSCGCTSVPLTKNRLAPGDSVSLALKFDTRRFKGKLSKTATVETNDTLTTANKLKFTAEVGMFEGIMIANPAMVYLDTLGKSEQVVMIKNTSVAPYKISIASPLEDFMHFELSTTELEGKGEAAILIRATPQTPIGEYNASVTLHFEGPQPQNLTIPVYGVGYLP
ncbi:MAG TPA: DUF1573 domain-containing protein [bacterium]|nr:DUF1573 domain-containing protein [bacterium]